MDLISFIIFLRKPPLQANRPFPSCLCRLSVKRVFVRNHSYENVLRLQVSKSFSYDRFCTRPRFETEAQGNGLYQSITDNTCKEESRVSPPVLQVVDMTIYNNAFQFATQHVYLKCSRPFSCRSSDCHATLKTNIARHAKYTVIHKNAVLSHAH